MSYFTPFRGESRKSWEKGRLWRLPGGALIATRSVGKLVEALLGGEKEWKQSGTTRYTTRIEVGADGTVVLTNLGGLRPYRTPRLDAAKLLRDAIEALVSMDARATRNLELASR